jgi:hypothetical protein
MNTAQIFIIASAAIALPLILTSRPATFWNRVGCAIGLVGQPFWLLETMRADQFGMYLCALWFTGCYVFGLLRPTVATAPVAYVDLQAGRLS